MKEIKCIYKSGEEKTFPYDIFGDPYDIFGEHIENILQEIREKKGITYTKFLDSPLTKVYIDNELVLDREELLEVE